MFGKSIKEEQRSEKYKALCILKDLAYLDIDEYGTKAYLQTFELFKHRNGKIRNLCQYKSSSLDCEINLFDFKYTISTGKTFHTFDQTVFFINSKQLGLPDFRMKPETFVHRLISHLGWEDIDFEEYPSFSEKYHLTGDQEDFIRFTFDDKVLKFFSKTSGWSIEAANYYLIFYAANSLVPNNILVDFYRLGMGIFNLFKDEPKNEY